MDPLYAQAGDVFFTHSSSLLGRLIRWAESDPGERAWANHVGIVVSPGWLVPPSNPPAGSIFQFDLAVVVESLWHTEKWVWWENHKKEIGNEIRVYRTPLVQAQLEDTLRLALELILDRADEFVGLKYGWWKLFAHLGDRYWFKGKKTISNFLRVDKRPICSYTAAKSFAAGFVFFGDMEPEAADPDEMMDYCERSSEWQLVGGSRVESK
jgi:hypothetical protein